METALDSQRKPTRKLDPGPQEGPGGALRDVSGSAGPFDRRRALPNAEYLRILADCRDLMSHRLLVSLTSMMDRLADGLLTRANQTNVLSESTLLLESRSVLQSHRAFIVNAFEKGLRARIDRRLQGEAEPPARGPDGDAELELVDDAQLEEEIAVKNFTQSLANRCHDELIALNARIGFLVGERHLATEDNPFGPQALGTAFRDAWQGVDIRREGKVIIIRMMDAGVIGDVNSIYADINRHLANLNVLPQLHGAAARSAAGDNASTGAHAARAAAAGAADTTDPDVQAPAGESATDPASTGDLFAMLRDLLGRAQRATGRSAPAAPTVAAAPQGTGAMPGATSAGDGKPVPGVSHAQLAALLPLMMRAGGGPASQMPPHGGAPAAPGVDTSDADSATAALTALFASHAGTPMSAGTAGSAVVPGQQRIDGAMPAGAVGAPSMPMTVDAQAMIESLTRLQQAYGRIAADGRGAAAGRAHGTATGAAVQSPPLLTFDPYFLRGLGPNELGTQIDSTGAVTIELVAMLFDFVAAEEQLPEAIKSLLYRLQIPVLKAALLDQGFFTQRTHPARVLVNRYAEAGVAWRVEQGVDDPLYRKIRTGVERIQSELNDKLDLFSDVLADFEAFLVSEEERAEKTVRKSADEIARRERQEQAVVVTDGELDRRINSAQPPEFLVSFLRNQWRQVLVNAYVETGEEGAGWRAVLSEMDNLLWSVQPKWKIKDRKDLVMQLPEMLSRLRTRLSDIEWEINSRERFMSELVECHARAVTATMEREAQSKPPMPLSGALAGSEPEAADETPRDQYHELAESMARGMWVEFEEDNGILVFAKLSWVSPLRGKYLFTHRNGTKAFSLTRDELAQRFREDRARPVETEPLLDRAFSDVLSRLSAQAGV